MLPADQTLKPVPSSQLSPASTITSSDENVIRVKGKNIRVPSKRIFARTVITNGKWLTLASIRDEDLTEGELVADPEAFVSQLKESGLKADLFTFVQKLPDTHPQYTYHTEWDNLAIIPITTYANWFEKQAESSVRRAVRKAAKSGVVVLESELDDAFVQGIVNINNETPIRQGRPFWHYQKSLEDVRRENATYPERTIFLGAYLEDALIGFIRITFVDRVASIIQQLSMIKHYDKRPANALIAKAVEICEQRGYQYLMYCNYVYNDPNSSLTEFKRRSGFQKVLLPRYFIPLTAKGQIALRLGLHHGLLQRIPKPIVSQLLKFRNRWYEHKVDASKGSE